jgi:hypothetical protein
MKKRIPLYRDGNPIPNPHVKSAHNMTASQFEDLRQKQEKGEVEMIPANNASPDKIGDKIFREAYANHQIPAHEKHIYHAAIEARLHDPGTGERISIHTVKKFSKEAFEFMKEHGFSGQTIHLLHNPELEKLK